MDKFLESTWGVPLAKSFIGDDEIASIREWFRVSLRRELTEDHIGRCCAVVSHFAKHFDFRRLEGLVQQILIPRHKYSGFGCVRCRCASKPPCYDCYWASTPVLHCDECHVAVAGSCVADFVDEFQLTTWATNHVRDTMERFEKHRGLARTDRIYEIMDLCGTISSLFDMVVIVLQDNRRQAGIDGAIPFVLWIAQPPMLLNQEHVWDFALAQVIRPIGAFKGDFPYVLACPHRAFHEQLTDWKDKGREGLWNGHLKRDFQFRAYRLCAEDPVLTVEPHWLS